MLNTDLKIHSLAKVCGDPSLTPDPIYTSMNYLWMRFVTDGSVQNRGFALNYTTLDSHCGGILRDQTSGVLQSPTDTQYYPHGADCIWIIRSEVDTILRLTWLAFALENHGTCGFDYVEIFDDDGVTNGTSMGRYLNFYFAQGVIHKLR